jgi:hypothetical protein
MDVFMSLQITLLTEWLITYITGISMGYIICELMFIQSILKTK